MNAYIVRTKLIDPKAIKEHHLKRLHELSIKSIGEIPQLDQLTEEQKEYVDRKMYNSSRNWEANT